LIVAQSPPADVFFRHITHDCKSANKWVALGL